MPVKVSTSWCHWRKIAGITKVSGPLETTHSEHFTVDPTHRPTALSPRATVLEVVINNITPEQGEFHIAGADPTGNEMKNAVTKCFADVLSMNISPLNGC